MKSEKAKSTLLAKDRVLSEIVKRFVKEFQPTKIILFGSRAAGTAQADSDYDILVVVPTLAAAPRTLSLQAHSLLSDLDAAKDIFFTSLERFEARKAVVNTLAEIAYHDGEELYAA